MKWLVIASSVFETEKKDLINFFEEEVCDLEFYDFGLAFDLFLNEKDDASKLFYFAPENFWKSFPPYGEKAKEISRKDLFRNIEIISKENEFSKYSKSRRTIHQQFQENNSNC